jgi:gamma-glutamyltranspeptidase / glutathione hydrolase
MLVERLEAGMMRSRRWLVLGLVGMAGLALGAALTLAQSSTQPPPFGTPSAADPKPSERIAAARGDRASGWVDQSRTEVLARRGMVATSEPLATQVGLRILQQGGNAADAAVATAAELALVEPGSTQLGGDMFALYYSARDRQLYGLNASGWSPEAWTPDYFAAKGFDAESGMPTRGPDTVSVPGAVDGWDRLLDRFGTMGFREVLEPAARDAEEGFALTEREHTEWADTVNKLRRDPDSAETFLVDGQAPPLYGVFRNRDLARTLRTLQKHGRDAFYEGDIARAIVRKLQSVGGSMTYDDLRDFRSEWVKPISTSYHGYDVFQIPPNTQGFATLETLNILEACAPRLGLDLAALGPRSPQFWHLLVEAKKLAFADLDAYNGDPRFTDVPLDRLLSKEYASSLCERIDPDRASTPSVTTDVEGGTIYLAVADRWGNMASFIFSIYNSFGSGITVPGHGFVLHDRAALFSLDRNSPNVVAPRKRPFHTIIPAFVMKDGRPVMAFGSMGGSVQPQAQVTELVNMIDLGMNVQAAGDAARFRHDQGPNVLQLESNLYDLVGAQLAAMGHNVRSVDGSSMGGYQAIHSSPDGVYRAGSDFRKDGAAAGW